VVVLAVLHAFMQGAEIPQYAATGKDRISLFVIRSVRALKKLAHSDQMQITHRSRINLQQSYEKLAGRNYKPD
jgi:hypothetical protein